MWKLLHTIHFDYEVNPAIALSVVQLANAWDNSGIVRNDPCVLAFVYEEANF